MHDPAVGLQKSPGMAFVGELHPGPQEVIPFGGIELPVMLVVRPLPPLAGKLVQVDVLTEGGLLVQAFFRRLL